MAINQPDTSLDSYLAPAEYVDSDHPLIVEFAKHHSQKTATDIDNAMTLYLAVRDEVAYTPYWDFEDAETFRASTCLKTGKGMCQSKAGLLAAAARINGIPARVGFADVINHMSSKKFSDILGTNVFRWHAYADLFLDGKWVKATPAFDAELCTAFNVPPLEFNGYEDSLFQPMNDDKQKFMEYVGEHGTFADIPRDTILADFKEHYQSYFTADPDLLRGSIQDDLIDEKKS